MEPPADGVFIRFLCVSVVNLSDFCKNSRLIPRYEVNHVVVEQKSYLGIGTNAKIVLGNLSVTMIRPAVSKTTRPSQLRISSVKVR